MKMSVVGCEASGKTVFLSALADYYNGGERPCLVPENEAANSFQRYQLRQMRALHQWPVATDPGKIIELKWSLRDADKTLAEIELLEFGGETYREAFRGESGSSVHQESVETLKRHLGASEFVVVLVSLRDLLRDLGSMSQEEFDRDTEAVWVTRGLLEFLRDHVPNARVVIGLTQADLHRGEIAAAGGAAELFRRHWPTIAALAANRPVVAVASVSATDENGNPAPDYTTDGILPVMDEFTKSAAKPSKSRRGEIKSVTKSSDSGKLVILLLLLLGAAGALLFQYADQLRALFPKPAPEAIPAVGTNAIEQTVAETNAVKRIIAETNAVEHTAASTGSAFRVWHDHNGVPIEARWLSTTDDKKRIVIETLDGRQIRASIRKFSETDRQFIAERLGTATNTVEKSANPAL